MDWALQLPAGLLACYLLVTFPEADSAAWPACPARLLFACPARLLFACLECCVPLRLCVLQSAALPSPHLPRLNRVCCAMLRPAVLCCAGQLGDVLEESARIALSWVRAHAVALGLPGDASCPSRKWDVHIHLPAGV